MADYPHKSDPIQVELRESDLEELLIVMGDTPFKFAHVITRFIHQKALETEERQRLRFAAFNEGRLNAGLPEVEPDDEAQPDIPLH